MKKKLQLFISVTLLMFLLAACGTTNGQNTEPDQTTADSEKEIENVEDEETTENGAQDEETNQPENKIEYTSKGEVYTHETAVVEEENYTIQILEGYELTKEEPGKEVLFLQDNDAISMRIEVFPKNASSYDHLVKSTEEWMAAINEYKPLDITEAVNKHPEITNSVAFITTIENDEVVGIVYEKNNILVRLSAFDQKDYDLKDALIKMGLTIEEK